MKWKPSRKLLLYVLVTVGLTLACLFLVNDAKLYQKTIVEVTGEETTSLGKTTGENGITEAGYRQAVTATVKNGSRSGDTVTFDSEYTGSQVKTTRYRVGDQLFVRIQEKDGKEIVSVLSVKRDAWLVGLIGLFACTLCFFYQGRGVLILLSLAVNVGLIVAVLKFGDMDVFFNRQWLLLMIAFCIITLLLVGGIRRQTFGAILSTLVTAFLMLLLYQLTVNQSSVIPYDMLEDSLGSIPIEDIFRFSVIAGSIGAIMDVSVAIHTSMDKLSAAGKIPDLKSALASMRQIGADIMGTMINVLFFSYVSQSLPITILKITSGYSMSSIFSYDLIFDFVRFLLGSIGIVLTIPVSEGVALLMGGKTRRCGK